MRSWIMKNNPVEFSQPMTTLTKSTPANASTLMIPESLASMHSSYQKIGQNASDHF